MEAAAAVIVAVAAARNLLQWVDFMDVWVFSKARGVGAKMVMWPYIWKTFYKLS